MDSHFSFVEKMNRERERKMEMIQDQDNNWALRHYEAGTDLHEQWEVEREEQKERWEGK